MVFFLSVLPQILASGKPEVLLFELLKLLLSDADFQAVHAFLSDRLTCHIAVHAKRQTQISVVLKLDFTNSTILSCSPYGCPCNRAGHYIFAVWFLL